MNTTQMYFRRYLRRLFSSDKLVHNLWLVEPVRQVQASIDLEQLTRRKG
jgi:hypothetical protein